MTDRCTPKQLQIIREMARSEPDHIIGQRLGFHPRKVCSIRKENGIPACNKAHWSPEKVEQARVWYVEEGLTATEVAKRLGCGPNVVRALKSKRAWERSPEAYERNRAERAALLQRNRANVVRPPRPSKPPKEKKPKAQVVAKPLKAATPPKRRDLSRAPVNFTAERAPTAPLDVRILSALKARPLNTSTLAIFVDAKEAVVSMQLAAMAHEGRVHNAGGEGRAKVWEAA